MPARMQSVSGREPLSAAEAGLAASAVVRAIAARVITAFFMVFYLAIMVYGGWSSSAYSLKYNQTNYSAWAPPMAPIKIIMTVGIALMLLQAISMFFKDVARVTGREIA